MKIEILIRYLCTPALLLLVACGGGGGGGGVTSAGGSDSSPNIQTGRFVDGPVAGLHYETATQSGETNANGEFSYIDGETVSFFVGDIKIGEAVGAAQITPFDLAGEPPPTSGADIKRAVNRSFAMNVATPFDVVVNIAVFLQTLDEDGDAANGIQIPAQMQTLARGASLNWAQPYDPFRYSFQFRKLIAEGRAAGLWGGTRAISNSAYAMDRLYAGLGLTPKIDAESKIENDTDGNGTVDEINTSTYDANGDQTLFEQDTDADGTVDRRYTYAYSTNGNRTLEEDDTNADGTVDRRSTSTYTTTGRWANRLVPLD
jgi:hypothetical protein